MRKGMSYSEAGRMGWEKTKDVLKKNKEKRINTYNDNPKLCRCCGKALTYLDRFKRFCNHSCSAKFNNIGVTRNGKNHGNCLNCNSPLKQGNKKYCSINCSATLKWKIKKEQIKNGKYNKTYSGDKLLRKFLIEEVGYKCNSCKLSEWKGQKIPLNVHHVDGDASNNSPSNIELICLNCHGLTENFGKKNKKCTRDYRKKGFLCQSGSAATAPLS